MDSRLSGAGRPRVDQLHMGDQAVQAHGKDHAPVSGRIHNRTLGASGGWHDACGGDAGGEAGRDAGLGKALKAEQETGPVSGPAEPDQSPLPLQYSGEHPQRGLISGLASVADMTEALAAFFRYTISKVENLVSVEEELQNCETYFRIQQYRFGPD